MFMSVWDKKIKVLTFLAAALKASLWLISGLPALIRWISSLQERRDKGITLINVIYDYD